MKHIPIHFQSGYRGILLLHRNKDGCKGNAQRKSFNKIVNGVDEWVRAVEEFKQLKATEFPDHRIYASVNARDPLKCMREFKRRQLDHDYESTEKCFEFYMDVKNRFFSCFMNPGSRAESNFLIDCDTPEEYKYAKANLKPELIIFEYPTKNGMHIITKPFDPCFFELEVKKDDLLYIG